MGRKSVAVLDIRSSAVTVVIGEAGINHTFIFRGRDTQPYSGYDADGFFDVEELANAIAAAVSAVEHSSMEKIKEIVVGVPGNFIELLTKRHLISFQFGRRVMPQDITTLYESGMKGKAEGGRIIRRSNMYFITSDKRRTINPVGMRSDSLEGFLCYFVCSDYFTDTIERILHNYGVSFPYSPGYCGWHVSQQQLLFSMLPPSPCGVRLNDSSLMYPIKSVSGIIAVGSRVKKQKYGCELCGKVDCYKNRNKAKQL